MMKKTSGRQRIEIKRIENTSSRQVTFTKRRQGLFKKASELCVLTGAEMAILVESKGGRVFAFANPSADSVIDTYLENNVSNSSPENPTYMHEEYNKEYEKICKELEVEKNKSNSCVEESGRFWWENSCEDLEVDELEIFINSLEQLKLNVTKKAEELKNMSASSSSDKIVDGLFDEFISDNIDHANEDLMMSAVSYNSNAELVLDNHDDEYNDGFDNFQVQSDYGTFGVPDDIGLL